MVVRAHPPTVRSPSRRQSEHPRSTVDRIEEEHVRSHVDTRDADRLIRADPDHRELLKHRLDFAMHEVERQEPRIRVRMNIDPERGGLSPVENRPPEHRFPLAEVTDPTEPN